MKRKGFTLIELLAVIIILGILIAIVAPQVVNNINESKEKAVTVLENSIKNAAELYITEHANSYPALKTASEATPYTFTVSLATLVNFNYLEEPVINPSTDEEIPLSTTVSITATAEDNITIFFTLSPMGT
ncbi:MAG: prepilin-type N-terminal cleavage/methylation domain-containing protein [Bacilli bacterium]|nr:prepilin-type N-terminal cleavage/methylation domain-containing protein [Bacilli bacterium]